LDTCAEQDFPRLLTSLNLCPYVPKLLLTCRFNNSRPIGAEPHKTGAVLKDAVNVIAGQAVVDGKVVKLDGECRGDEQADSP